MTINDYLLDKIEKNVPKEKFFEYWDNPNIAYSFYQHREQKFVNSLRFMINARIKIICDKIKQEKEN